MDRGIIRNYRTSVFLCGSGYRVGETMTKVFIANIKLFLDVDRVIIRNNRTSVYIVIAKSYFWMWISSVICTDHR